MAQLTVALGFPANVNEWIETSIGSTAETIKATAGTAFMLNIDNTNNAGAASYVKLYDTNAAVTVGTTVPDWTFKIPAGQAVIIPLLTTTAASSTQGISFANGLVIACVTVGGTAGTTAPTSAVIARVIYS
jgi:hypothetical protein